MQEYNFLEETYAPIVEQEKLLNSKGYQNLKKNNIDTAELDGIEKDPNAGKIEFKELSKEDNQIFFKDVTDFIFKDLPKDTIISLIKGGTNATQFLNNIVYATGITPADDNIMLNEKLDKVKSQLDNLQEDSPLVSKLMAIVAQDAAFTYPIYKKLDKAGVPKAWSLPIAFGLGGTLAFDKAETFFVDSAAMRGLKDLIGVEPDTPIEEMYDKTIQALEYSAFGKIADTIFNGAKAVKKMNLQQPATATAGAGIAGAGAMELQEQTPDLNVENPDLDQEKKTLNFDEQEQISSPMPGDDEMASAGSVFGPIFKSIVRETAKKLPNKGTGEQIFNTLKNSPGVKSSELKWTGLDEFLKGKKSVTKEEIQEYLKLNSLDVAEVKFGGKLSDKQWKIDDDLDNMINEFESKVAKVTDNFDEITGTRNINYDVYKYGETSQGLTGKSKPNMTISFSSLMDSMDFYRQGNLQRYLSDDYLKDGTVTIVRLFDDRAGTTIITPPELAKKLLKEESNKYSFAKKIEVPELEFEKLIVENARREANKKMPNAPKFNQPGLVEPGGEDYTELVFKIKKGGMDVGIPSEIARVTPANEQVLKRATTPYKNPAHMNIKSEIAHVRFKTRDLNDMKVLTVEEMQSDFATAVRKSNTSLSGSYPDKFKDITDFPFKNTWYEMTVKRLIRYAADNGFDAVAIPKGSVIQDRYKLTRRVKELEITSFNPKRKEIGFFGRDQNGATQIDDLYSFNRIEKEFGKDVLDRIINKGKKLYDPDGNFLAYGESEELLKVKLPKTIEIGGEGKTQLYNVAIPKFMKKYAKKWNAKVYDEEIIQNIDTPTGVMQEGFPVTIIKLTPEMKKAVQTDGQALFSIFGIGSTAAVGAKALSDSKGNNTISNQTVY